MLQKDVNNSKLESFKGTSKSYSSNSLEVMINYSKVPKKRTYTIVNF